MITSDDLCDAAPLPSVEPNPAFGKPAFRVQGKLLMSALGYQSAIVHVDAATTTAGNDPATSVLPPPRADASGFDDG